MLAENTQEVQGHEAEHITYQCCDGEESGVLSPKRWRWRRRMRSRRSRVRRRRGRDPNSDKSKESERSSAITRRGEEASKATSFKRKLQRQWLRSGCEARQGTGRERDQHGLHATALEDVRAATGHMLPLMVAKKRARPLRQTERLSLKFHFL